MNRWFSVASARRAAGGLAGLALVLGCAFVVSACGSSSAAPASSSTGSTTTTTTTTGSGTTSSAGFTAYRNCLQSHGLTLPQGGGFSRRGATGARGPSGARGASGAGGFFRRGGSGPTGTRGFAGNLTAKQQKALAACAKLRPAGGGGGFFGGGSGAANNPAFAKFEACLKKHGVQTGSTADRNSSSFQAALSACRSLLPSGAAGGFFGGGGGGAGTTGTGGTATTSSDFAKFQACLKQHGIQPGAANQSQSATSAALAACRSLLPNNGNGTGSTTTTTG